jgi:hypothetical protein
MLMIFELWGLRAKDIFCRGVPACMDIHNWRWRVPPNESIGGRWPGYAAFRPPLNSNVIGG